MAKLFLVRHVKSQWNEENRFAGWVDIPLNEDDLYDAKFIADKTINKFRIDKIYCSALFRNMDTVARMFEYGNKKYPIFTHLDGGNMQWRGKYIDISEHDVPIYITELLNERYYGDLQGMNKAEAMKKFGAEKIKIWRRSWKIAPPGGESLKAVFKRVVSFYKKNIEKELRKGNNVLIVASHNPLRALAKFIEKISDDKIANYEIPYGGIVEYDIEDGVLAQKRNIS